MKIIDITLKDLSQSFRSFSALAFMFGVPILVTTMFYFMFGGIKGEDEEKLSLPQTQVQVVNLDLGSPQFAAGMDAMMPGQTALGAVDISQAGSMGELLVLVLQSETLADLVAVTVAPDIASARAAVDSQQAGVAIIIPENFTQAMFQPGEQAVIEMYQDPTLTIGPQVVKSFLSQMMEYMAGIKIGTSVIDQQLAEAGITLDGSGQQALAMQLLGWSDETGQGSGNMQESPYLELHAPGGDQEAQVDQFTRIISTVMAGMMVFYAFYTGAVTAQSILTEEEKGTLPRLFTTPTRTSHILSGKFLSAAVTVFVQITVLMLFGRLVFGIKWGDVGAVSLVALGIVVAAAAMGICLVSFLKNSRQAGIVYGGVLTMTGMLGIVSVFTVGVPTSVPVMNTISLLVPQGWAMRSLSDAMKGLPLSQVLFYVGGTLAWGAVFFIVGNMRLRKRYA